MGRGLRPSGEVDDSRPSRGGPLRPDSVRAWQEDFRHLYSRPELSHQEHRTAAHVAARLRHAGCEVHEQVDGTGVVVVLWTSDIVTAWDRSMCDLENRLSELAREPSRPALITWEIRRCQTSYSLCTSTM